MGSFSESLVGCSGGRRTHLGQTGVCKGQAPLVHRFDRTDVAPPPRVGAVMLRQQKRGPPLVPSAHGACIEAWSCRYSLADTGWSVTLCVLLSVGSWRRELQDRDRVSSAATESLRFRQSDPSAGCRAVGLRGYCTPIIAVSPIGSFVVNA